MTTGNEARCTCPEVDVTMPAGWRCPIHGAADQETAPTHSGEGRRAYFNVLDASEGRNPWSSGPTGAKETS